MPATPRHSRRSCPALAAATCVALGIVLADRVEPGPLWWTPAFAPALACIFLRSNKLVSLFPLVRALCAGLALLACGALSFSILRTPVPTPLTELAATESQAEYIKLSGDIAGAPERSDWGWQFALNVHEARLASGKTFPLQGVVQVFVYDSAMARVKEGDVVRLAGELRSLPPQRNPGSFDYGLYLRRHGISALFYAEEDGSQMRLGDARNTMMEVTVSARSHVRRQLKRYVHDERTRAMLHALILGQRHLISDATLNDFRSTGLLHLLAVSGLHVMLVGFVVYRLLQPLLLRLGLAWRSAEWLRAALTIALLCLYMLLTGAAASVVRAVIMAGFFLGATLLQRRTHSLNTLGGAALVILLLQPMQIFDVGFQLSFSAVGALILLPPVVTRRPSNQRSSFRWLNSSLLTSAAAILGTLPILLYHFGRVSIAGLLLNVPAIPASMLALASGLLVVVLGGWWAAAASVCASAATLWVHLLVLLARTGDKYFKWAAIESTISSLWMVAGISVLLLALAYLHAPRRRWRLTLVSLALLTIGLTSPLIRGDREPNLRVLFFDVGHGDAALISFPNGKRMLVDAGPGGRYAHTAERILLPFLRRRGIDRLDAVLISHPHGDHLGGLPALLREFPVGRVLSNGHAHTSDLYSATQHILDSLQIPRDILLAGDTLQLDPEVALQILSPARASHDLNNASLVLRMAYGETTWLFLGDIEADTELRLLENYAGLLPSDVVKVAHHGSRTSSLIPFVRQTLLKDAAEWAVVSVGDDNYFGLPDQDVLSRWEARGARVHSTAGGALWLQSDGRSITPIKWKDRY